MEEQAETLNELMATFKVNGMSARLRPHASRPSAATVSAPPASASHHAPAMERRSESRPWAKTASVASADAGPAAPAPRAKAVNENKDEWQEF